ncbi:hypothetical protein E7744_07535 [Citricoccus sp. SGAir0253]|uniref:amidohydrolase family protein n=1 Tax=Citricoccus sp. SGAir0253 TaxID=2567881 RepID=UPI0010CCFE48|nr:amidohydrolase family protein [Citricoccus sp. SGAir0253]QCU78054.1 hypothetical protein E7744_07535 [Citricoccus sp. SGAir0253]
MSTLYVNGTLHSTADPYATAMLVDGGSIAWVGADDTAAQMLSRSGAGWEVVDLDGALVAPAFVDSLAPGAGPGAPAAHGVFLSATVGGPGPDDALAGAHRAGDRTVCYPAVGPDRVPSSAEEAAAAVVPSPRDAGGAGPMAGLAAVVGPEGLDAARTTGFLAAATAAGVQAYLLPRDGDALAAVVSALKAAEEAQGPAATGRARHRVAWNGPVDPEAVAVLARTSASVTVAPAPGGRVASPVASLLAAGVPVALGSGTGADGADPWAGIRACLEHEDPAQRISARAGFAAATRAGLRALPAAAAGAHAAAGRLAPSAPATFALWATEALSVQAPDGRVAAWSTDARAGTPLLPVLEEGTAAPRCLATVVDGEVLYRSADAPLERP